MKSTVDLLDFNCANLSICYPLKVVGRSSETQLQAISTIWRFDPYTLKKYF